MPKTLFFVKKDSAFRGGPFFKAAFTVAEPRKQANSRVFRDSDDRNRDRQREKYASRIIFRDEKNNLRTRFHFLSRQENLFRDFFCHIVDDKTMT